MGGRLRKRAGSPYWWLRLRRGEWELEVSTKTTVKRRARAAREEVSRAVTRGERDKALLARVAELAVLGEEAPLEAAREEMIPGARRLPLDEFLRGPYVERHVEPRASGAQSRRNYLGEIRALLSSPALGDLCLDEVGPEQAEAFRRWTLDRGLSKATANRRLSRLRHAMRKAVEWGFLESFPLESVALQHEEPERVPELSAEEEERLLDACGPRLRPLIGLLLTTGLRRGEALALRWEDVQGDTLMVRRTGKTWKERTIPLVGPVLGRARVFLDMIPRRVGSPYLFPSPHKADAPLRGDSVSQGFRRARRRAGLDRLRLHDLRHVAASRLVRAGLDLYRVGLLLGHRKGETTRRYSHLRTEDMRRALDALERGETGAVGGTFRGTMGED